MKYIFLFLLISNLSLAQINNNRHFSNSSEKIDEKIVLRTDRNLYISGEKIWFKAFCYTPGETRQTNLSNVLYVELYNNSREFMVKRKFNISDGSAFGSIDIPSEFLSGNYFLRAYTQFLKSHPLGNYFTSLITVVNPNIVLPEKTNLERANIQIIPSGGELLDGIKTQVVCKINEDISHRIESIYLIDGLKNIISSPSISKNGICLFEITPSKLSNYAIKLLLEGNDSIIQPLPDVSEIGMSVKSKISSNGELVVDIINKGKRISEISQNYRLMIYSQNARILAESNFDLINQESQLKFSADVLEEGINNLIIKNKQDSIIKFSAFYHQNKVKQLNISTDKENYSQRERIQLNIKPINNSNDYIPMDLSISVIKKGTTYKPDILFKYIMECPQLIESYLQDIEFVSLLTDEQINTLMIIYSNMVSQTSFQKMLKKNTSITQWIPEIRDKSIISGRIYNKTNGLPLPNTLVYLSTFAPNQLHIYKSQQNGAFVFSVNNLVDHQNIFLCSNSNLGSEVEFQINDEFLSEFPAINNVPLSIDASQYAFLEEMYVNMQAEEIFGKKRGTKHPPEITFPFNFWIPQISIAIDDYVKTETLEVFLREIIPDLKVQKKKDQYSLSLYDDGQDLFIDDPLIMVDNIPVFNVNNLLDIPLANVEKIDLHLGTRMIGGHIINGVVVLSTNSDNFGGIKLPEGSSFLEYQAISASYGFDPPVYDTAEKKSSRLADFRNLLYWNPNLRLTDNDASVSFYTSDHCSEYEVIIKGYTTDGSKCYGKTSFKVE